MTDMTVGDRIAELLIEHGVEYVYGLPGGQTLPFYEGIRKKLTAGANMY